VAERGEVVKKKLFVVYIGGRTTQSLIELHDMRFVLAATIEETYEALKKTWWGVPESLHLDCWGALESADGYKIDVVETPVATSKKLYFVNLGAYSPRAFTEVHRNLFLVAESEGEAKRRAVASIQDFAQGHKDHLYEAESAICVSQVVSNQLGEPSLHLQLSPSLDAPNFKFNYGYVPIGKGQGVTGKESAGEVTDKLEALFF
jgi:hypothetical protein